MHPGGYFSQVMFYAVVAFSTMRTERAPWGVLFASYVLCCCCIFRYEDGSRTLGVAFRLGGIFLDVAPAWVPLRSSDYLVCFDEDRRDDEDYDPYSQPAGLLLCSRVYACMCVCMCVHIHICSDEGSWSVGMSFPLQLYACMCVYMCVSKSESES